VSSTRGQVHRDTTSVREHGGHKSAAVEASTFRAIAAASTDSILKMDPADIIVVPEAAVCSPVAATDTAPPDRHQAEQAWLQSQQFTQRKRKPDPNNELSVALGSVTSGDSKNKKVATAAIKSHGTQPFTSQFTNCDNDKITHTNEAIRRDLEAKAYQIIRDHEIARLADMGKEGPDSVAEESRGGLSALPSDSYVIQYFPNIVQAFNKGSTGDLRTAVESILAPNCVYRTHIVRVPGQTKTYFPERTLSRTDVFPVYRSMLEIFPDAFWKVESNKILESKDGTVKTVAGYFTFRGSNDCHNFQFVLMVTNVYVKATMLKEVYQDKIEQKYESLEPEKTKEIADKRSPAEHVDIVGIYVLTLNSQNLVRHFELVYVAGVKKMATKIR
jgi:hypothetical protein